MKGVLRKSISKGLSFYTKPKSLGHANDLMFNTKTCVYKSPAIKASVIKLKKKRNVLKF